MLSDPDMNVINEETVRTCLNAPYGARCFLTTAYGLTEHELISLNAPYGARCFLTLGIPLRHLTDDELS